MSKSIEELANIVVETDYLIVGGGVVGATSAIRAKNNNPNLDITIIDKAKLEWSGDGVGLDNFNQVPLHKEDINREVSEEDAKKAIFGAKRLQGLQNLKLDAKQMKNAFISQSVLEDVGVRIREDDGTLYVLQAYRTGVNWGRVEYDEDGKPCEPLFGSFSRASDLKQKLGAAVRKGGTKVLDRTMLTSIVTRDGVAVGVTAINTRTNEFLFIKAKAILLSTGFASRVYVHPSSPYPNNLFYSLTAAVNHGGGQACAFDAGAKLYSMEMGNFYNVSKGINHSSGGGGCNWYYRMYNSKGESLEAKYPEKMVTKAGGRTPGINYLFSPDIANAEVFNDVILSYKDKADNDLVSAVYFTAVTEPTKALKFHKLAGGLTNEPPSECTFLQSGIGQAGGGVFRETLDSETSIQNLFAAGGVTGVSGSAGFTWACLVADHVTEMVKGKELPKIDGDQLQQIEAARSWVFAPLGRKADYVVNPLELEDYIRHLIYNYVGVFKYTSKMQRALDLLKRAELGAVPLLTANSPHELMRVIEVQHILEIAQLHVQSSLLRDESRIVPVHFRIEYPELNDEKWFNKIVTVKKINGEAKYEIEKLNKDM